MTEGGGTVGEGLARWIDGSVRAVLDRLQLRGGPAAPAAGAGPYRTRRKGRSLEYAGFREYVPGDDPRFLDWQALARFDRPFVREYTAEQERLVSLLLDGSASMAAGGKGPAALGIAAALGYCGLRQGDRLEVVWLEGTGARRLGAGRGRASLSRLAAWLEAAAVLAGGTHGTPAAHGRGPDGQASPASRPASRETGDPSAGHLPGPAATALLPALSRWREGDTGPPGAAAVGPAGAPRRRGGLAVLISDLLDPAAWGRDGDPGPYARQVAALLAGAGQGVIIHLLAPWELGALAGRAGGPAGGRNRRTPLGGPNRGGTGAPGPQALASPGPVVARGHREAPGTASGGAASPDGDPALPLPPPPGEWTLVDAETGAAVEITIDARVLEAYLQGVARWVEGWRRACHAHGVVHVVAPAPYPLHPLVVEHLVPAGVLS